MVNSLAAEFRHQAEACFQENLRGVRVRVVECPGTASPGGVCLGENDIILFGPLDYEDAQSRAILIHEICHSLQKAKGRLQPRGRPTHVLTLELEAAAAEAAFQAGAVLCGVSASRDRRPLRWGPAGHYYAVYAIALAAGFLPKAAAKCAFMAQLPDLATELDATAMGGRYASAQFHSTSDAAKTDSPEAAAANYTARFNALAVQQGLHCLTGRSSAKETAARTAILLKCFAGGSFDPLRAGLAVHAFGDSFAHRVLKTPELMYSPALGHSVEWLNGVDPHCPDFLYQRPELFLEYTGKLYDAFATSTPSAARRLDKAALQAAFRIVVQEKQSEDGYISRIRAIAENRCQSAMTSLKPEDSPLMPWNSVAASAAELMVNARLQNAQAYALEWANVSA